MSRRGSAFIVIALFLVVSALSYFSQPSNFPTERPPDPHLLPSALSLVLDKADPSNGPPTVRVTLTNFHSSTTVAVLMWDSPFDPEAVSLGVFRIKEATTGEYVPIPKVKINRQLPPPRDAFLEVQPRHAITKDVVLDTQTVPLLSGMSYEIRAEGNWTAVWRANILHVGKENLRRIGGPTGTIQWEYNSDPLVMALK